MACLRHHHDGQGPARLAPWPPEGAGQAPPSGGAYLTPCFTRLGAGPPRLSSWRRARPWPHASPVPQPTSPLNTMAPETFKSNVQGPPAGGPGASHSRAAHAAEHSPSQLLSIHLNCREGQLAQNQHQAARPVPPSLLRGLAAQSHSARSGPAATWLPTQPRGPHLATLGKHNHG